MITIGVDAHKRSHTLVAVDGLGRILEALVAGVGPDEYAKALGWAREQHGPEITWGIEDARHVSGGFERALSCANESVVRVPTRLMKRSRASSRAPGKSDPIDAAAVARAVMRDSDLPRAALDGPSREVKLLVDRRDDLVAQRSDTPAALARRLWLNESKRVVNQLEMRCLSSHQTNRSTKLVVVIGIRDRARPRT